MSTLETTFFNGAVAPAEHAAARVRKLSLPWHRLALGAILLIAAFLSFYQLDREGFANSYYAAAVRSMSMSWHNFFFAAFDPNAFVTIDKPPLGFWFQVASVKLFGFNGVSLLLPEGLAGVLSVALLYHLVKRVYGQTAGLLAALCMALTPVAVADNRNNTIDSILVLFMLLGAWAVSRAVEERRSGLRWLLLCAVFVGLGFNIKMLEAYLVVPAFALMYLLGAKSRWRARLAHLLLAGVVLLSVSLSWAVAVDLTPASQRPWVDSTTTNSEIDLAIGYNGLQRLLGHVGTPGASSGAQTAAAAARTGTNTSTTGGTLAPSTTTLAQTRTSNSQSAASGAQGPGNGGGGLFNNGAAGPFRLLGAELGGQAGWLVPFAVIALLAAASRRLRFPLDTQQIGLVLWGAWLLTMAGFYSVASFFHSYYLVTIAPAVAALAGIGLVALWRDYLEYRSLTHWRGWMLPIALAATAGAQVYILSGYPDWSRWLAPLVLVPTLVAAAVLVAARILRRRAMQLWTPLAAAVGMLALLAAPTVWAANTVGTAGGGIPSAGPSAQGTNGGDFAGNRPTGGFGQFGGGQGGPPNGFPGGQPPAGGPSGNGRAGIGGGGTSVNTQLLSYLLKNQGSDSYLLVTTSSNSAAPYIIKTGKAVMSLGGFGGNDPILTLAQFKALVAKGTVRFVLAGGGGGGQDGGSAVMQWVQSTCTSVPASTIQGASTSSSTGTATGGFGGQNQLYDCAGA